MDLTRVAYVFLSTCYTWSMLYYARMLLRQIQNETKKKPAPPPPSPHEDSKKRRLL